MISYAVEFQPAVALAAGLLALVIRRLSIAAAVYFVVAGAAGLSPYLTAGTAAPDAVVAF